MQRYYWCRKNITEACVLQYYTEASRVIIEKSLLNFLILQFCGSIVTLHPGIVRCFVLVFVHDCF